MENRKKQNLTMITGLLERTRDIVYRYEVFPERGCTYISPAVKNLTGYTVEEHYKDPMLFQKLVHPEDMEKVKSAGIRGAEGLKVHRIIHKDGSVRWIERNDTPVKDNKGNLIALEGVIRDVTEKKKFEQTLLESEQRYRELTENTLAGVYIIQEGKIAFCNLGFAQLFGYPYTDLLLGKPVIELVVPRYRKKVTLELELRESGQKKTSRYELEVIKSDGKWLPVEVLGSRTIFGGKPAVQGIIIDISERKKVLDALKKSEERFRLTFHTSPDSVNINRMRDGMYVDINEGFTQITGYTREDVIGHTSPEINIWADPTDREKLVERLKKSGKVENMEARFRMKNGTVVHGLMSASVIELDGETHIISVTRNIEEQVQAGKYMELQRRLQYALGKYSNYLVSSREYNRLFRYTVDICKKILEVETVVLIGRNPVTGILCKRAAGGLKQPLFPQAGISTGEASCWESLLEASGPVSLQSPECKSSGGRALMKRHHLATALAVPVPGTGMPWGLLIIGTFTPREYHPAEKQFMSSVANILGEAIIRKKTEQELHESEERYRDLYNNAPNGYFSVNVDGRIIRCNKRAGELLKYGINGLIGRPVMDLYADTPAGKTKAKKILRYFRKGGSVRNEELQMRQSDGSIIWISLSVTPVLDIKGKVVESRSVVVDISGRKQAEEALREYNVRLQKAQQVARMGFLDWNLKTDEIELSNQVVDMYGLDHNKRWITPEFVARVCHPDDREFVQKNLEAAIQGEKSYNIDHRIVRPDGSILWVHAQAELLKDDRGSPQQLLGTVVDITRRKSAEKSLIRQSQYQSLLNQLNEAANKGEELPVIVEILTKGTQKLFNCFGATMYILNETHDKLVIQNMILPGKMIRKIESLLSFKIPPVIVPVDSMSFYHAVFKEMDVINITSPEEIKRTMHDFKNIISIKKNMASELSKEVIPRVIDLFDLKGMLFAPLGMADNRIGVLGLSADRQFSDEDALLFGNLARQITSLLLRLRIRIALQESEERYRAVVENSHEGILIVGEDYRFEYVNETFCKILGYNRKEIIGHDFRVYLPEKSKRIVEERYKKRQRGEKVPSRYEFIVLRKDGGERLVEISSTVVKDSKGKRWTIAQLLDITERKKAENALRESEAKFRMLFDHAPDGYFILNADGIFLDGNAEAERITGDRKKAFIGENIFNTNLIPKEKKALIEDLMKQVAGGRITGPVELDLRTKTGTLVPVEVRSAPVVIKGKQCILGIARDISERKRVEKQLQVQSSALENAVNGVIITNPDGKIEWVNRAFTRITGYTGKEAVGQNPRILKSGKHDRDFYEKMWDAILKGKTWRSKIINKRKDGKLYTEELTIAPIFNEVGGITHFVGIQLDITKQEKALQELKITLDRLHRLSGHLNEMLEQERRQISRNLHDNLGQILTAVKMDISWLSRKLPETSPMITERLAETRNLVDEAMKAVQWITTELRPSVLDELGFWDALEWLCHEMSKRSGIAIVGILPREVVLPDNFTLPVYRVVQEAITNIVRHSKATVAVLRVVRSKNKIIFSVSDNGKSIPEEILTTHENFGLMGMKERIEILGGEFKILKKEKGTEVLFNLPLKNHKTR
ncbi:MAG: PAS domain S-box protein [Chlorobi bacterium]|nr:PAS domain S-box protein [Chlorobiota bacterium]